MGSRSVVDFKTNSRHAPDFQMMAVSMTMISITISLVSGIFNINRQARGNPIAFSL